MTRRDTGKVTDGHFARKRFSQNFLADEDVLDRIAAAIGPRADDAMLEIGPGLGALTTRLADRVARFRVVEIDRDLAARLGERWPDMDLVVGDVLRVDPEALFGGSEAWRVVGNLPYHISTPLIFRLLEQSRRIRDMHFLLQEEVVQRMAASPGSSAWGRLSVMVQYHCRVDALLAVPRAAFRPPPKVESRVVRLTPQPPAQPALDPALLERLVRFAFGQRRKTLRNGLKPLERERPGALEAAAQVLDTGRRAETLGVAEFVALADALAALPPTPQER